MKTGNSGVEYIIIYLLPLVASIVPYTEDEMHAKCVNNILTIGTEVAAASANAWMAWDGPDGPSVSFRVHPSVCDLNPRTCHI